MKHITSIMCMQVLSSTSALQLKTCAIFQTRIVRKTIYCPFVYSNIVHINNTDDATQYVIMCVRLYGQTVGQLSVAVGSGSCPLEKPIKYLNSQCIKISDHCATAKFQSGILAVFGWSLFEPSKTIYYYYF